MNERNEERQHQYLFWQKVVNRTRLQLKNPHKHAHIQNEQYIHIQHTHSLSFFFSLFTPIEIVIAMWQLSQLKLLLVKQIIIYFIWNSNIGDDNDFWVTVVEKSINKCVMDEFH